MTKDHLLTLFTDAEAELTRVFNKHLSIIRDETGIILENAHVSSDIDGTEIEFRVEE